MAKNAAHDHDLEQDDILLDHGEKKELPKQARILIIAGGVLLLIILGSIIFSLLGRTPENALQLTRVAKQQGIIIQAAELGVKGARGQEARNFAITTQLSLEGDQPILLDALKKQNVRVSVGKDPAVEKILVEAEQSNRLDEVLLEVLRTELNKYLKSLDTAYKTTVDKDLKEVLEQQYRNAEFLVTPLNERVKLDQ